MPILNASCVKTARFHGGPAGVGCMNSGVKHDCGYTTVRNAGVALPFRVAPLAALALSVSTEPAPAPGRENKQCGTTSSRLCSLVVPGCHDHTARWNTVPQGG